MNAFFEHHKNSIRLHYRCFDRLLLNGLIQPFQQPERVLGFFNHYREGQRVSRNFLAGIADQFQCWLKKRSEKRGAPIVEVRDPARVGTKFSLRPVLRKLIVTWPSNEITPFPCPP